jgi:hypothetical protein
MSVKFFASDQSPIDLSAIVPVFHRWIQQHSVEGLLIDVADYQHVFQGPGVILIGHEADYAVDMSEGRPGLLYRRKRNLGSDLVDTLRTLWRHAQAACALLEEDETLGGALKFRLDLAEIAFLDRLRTPNVPETIAALRKEIEAALAALYPGAGVQVEPVANDPRQPLTLHVRVQSA